MTAIICPECGLGNDMGPGGEDHGYDWSSNRCADCAGGFAPPWELCDICESEFEDADGDMHPVGHIFVCSECVKRPAAELLSQWGPPC